MTSSKTVVLVTGGNSGIGFDTCAAFAARAGIHVYLGSRSLDRGRAALADIQSRKLPGEISLVQLDVNDTSSIDAAAKTVAEEAGHLDVLVSNAGFSSKSDSLQARLRETIETNAIGPALVTEAFVPLLKKSSAPRLIYVSSATGSINLRLNPPTPVFNHEGHHYRMSKAALNMLSACHYMLFKEWGCKVSTFCPGYVITDLSRDGEAGKDVRRAQGALSSETSAESILEIFDGERDAHLGRFIHKRGAESRYIHGPEYSDGIYPW